MPIIQQNSKGGKIIFGQEDWLAGLNPQFTSSTGLRQKIGNGLAAVRSFDPYRDLGYASPGFMPTDLTNVSVIDAAQKNCVVNGGLTYSIGGTKVHQITLSNSTINTTPFEVTPTSGATVMEDIIVYKINDVKFLFYSWYDGTDGDIGTYNFGTWTTAGNWDINYMSDVPTGKAVMAKTYPMPMIVGTDDILYVADGNSVHAFDGGASGGANGTLSKNVLVLPTQYTITGFARYGLRLAIFATTKGAPSTDLYYLGDSKCYLWNYLDLDVSDVIDLNDNYVSAPFEWKGTIGCFTQGRTLDKTQPTKGCKLKLYNGSIFETVAIVLGNTPVIGGVDIVGDMIHWNTQGKIYSYGSPHLGLKAELNQIAEGSGTSSGFLKTLTTGLQAFSSGTTTGGGMQSLNSNYYFQSFASTALAKPNYPAGKKGKITTVVVKFAKVSTGGRAVSVNLTDRLGTSTTIISNLEEVTSAVVVAKYEDIEKKFDDLKCLVQWGSGTAGTDAPIIDSVEVEFEYINL